MHRVSFWRMMIGLIGCCWLVAGCEDPAHQQRINLRRENLQKTARLFEQEEAPRMDKLGRTFALLRTQHERDVEYTRRNPKIVRDWVENDIKRWNERQPIYGKAIQDQTKGDPENIKRTIPYMLY